MPRPDSRRPWLQPLTLAALALPLAALLVRASVEIPPSGPPSLSSFPLALWLLDPLTWDALRASLLMALAVALSARFLGALLARALVALPPRGRSFLTLAALAPAAFPPLWAAIGLETSLGPSTRWASTPLLGPITAAHCAWFTAALVTRVPLLALLLHDPLSRIPPAWTDAGRNLGAGPHKLWSTLVRPFIRPTAARATLAIFGLTLFDAATPLHFQLHRTLGPQIVSAFHGPDALPRATVLTLAGLFPLFLMLGLLKRLSRHDPASLLPAEPQSPPSPAPLIPRLITLAFALPLWAPFTGLFLPFRAVPFTDLPTLIADLAADPAVNHPLLASLCVGLTAALLSWLLSATWPRAPLTSIPFPLPGLVTATALAALASLLSPSRLLPSLSGLPTEFPLLVLSLTLLLTPLAIFLRSHFVAPAPPHSQQLAQILGAGRFRPPWRDLPPILLLASLAAFDSSAALLFFTSTQTQTLGPALLSLPHPAPAHLAALGLLLNLTLCALLARARRRIH